MIRPCNVCMFVCLYACMYVHVLCMYVRGRSVDDAYTYINTYIHTYTFMHDYSLLICVTAPKYMKYTYTYIHIHTHSPLI
jgi:hypothetical protein